MGFNRNKSHPREEPTFVFVANRKRSTRASGDKYNGSLEEESFTIPSFLRQGPLSTRTHKTFFATFKFMTGGESKAKTFKTKAFDMQPPDSRSPKVQTAEKNKARAQAKPAPKSRFDNDFARIAETAKPRYMTDDPGEPTEPKEPVFRHATHDVSFDASSKAKPQPEKPQSQSLQSRSDDEAPEGIFFFEDVNEIVGNTDKAPNQHDHDADEHVAREYQADEYEADDYDADDVEADDYDEADYDEDGSRDWQQQTPFFAAQHLNMPAGDQYRATYNSDLRARHRASFFIVSKLPLLAVVGLGIYAGAYFWPEKNPDEVTRAVATREMPAAAAQPDVDPRTIVPSGPGQIARTEEKATTDISEATPNPRTVEVKPKAPVPMEQPEEAASAPDRRATEPTESSAAEPQRRVALAPGPRPLSPYLSNSSDPSVARSSYSVNPREEALLSDFAVDVQRRLGVLGYSGVQQTGRMDAATRSAIRAFQLNSGLAPTGEVDSQTLKLMKNQSRIQ